MPRPIVYGLASARSLDLRRAFRRVEHHPAVPFEEQLGPRMVVGLEHNVAPLLVALARGRVVADDVARRDTHRSGHLHHGAGEEVAVAFLRFEQHGGDRISVGGHGGRLEVVADAPFDLALDGHRLLVVGLGVGGDVLSQCAHLRVDASGLVGRCQAARRSVRHLGRRALRNQRAPSDVAHRLVTVQDADGPVGSGSELGSFNVQADHFARHGQRVQRCQQTDSEVFDARVQPPCSLLKALNGDLEPVAALALPLVARVGGR